MTILILGNGEKPCKLKLKSDLEKSDFFICADGGANYARQLQFKPDFILGDLDSITQETCEYFKDVPIEKINDQNSTDFEKAVFHALSLNPDELIIWGILGERYDHSIGNLSSFVKYLRNQKAVIRSNNSTTYICPNLFTKSIQPGTTISLIPMPFAKGVQTTGLEWVLNEEDLELGTRVGTLNRTNQDEITISYSSGTLLIMEIQEE